MPLVDAVAAGCAVPGIWPPVSIEGHRYVDGGVRSADNADFAAGYDRMLVVVSLGSADVFPTEKPFADVVASLRAGGASVAVVEPDEASLTAIGQNPWTRSPGARPPRRGGCRGRAWRSSGRDRS